MPARLAAGQIQAGIRPGDLVVVNTSATRAALRALKLYPVENATVQKALDELQTKCAADVARVLSGEKPIYPVKAA